MSYVIDCKKCGKPFRKMSNGSHDTKCPDCRKSKHHLNPDKAMAQDTAMSTRLTAVEERLSHIEDDLSHVSQMANTATDTIVATAMESIQGEVNAFVIKEVERLAKERMDRLLLTMRKHMLEHIDELHERIDELDKRVTNVEG